MDYKNKNDTVFKYYKDLNENLARQLYSPTTHPPSPHPRAHIHTHRHTDTHRHTHTHRVNVTEL